ISVAVTNSQGPPVLWLALTANGQLLSTDEQWQVSLEGAVTRPARFASAPMDVRSGNPLAGGERPLNSFRARPPTLVLFALLSGGLLTAAHYWNKGQAEQKSDRQGLQMRSALIAAGLLWLLLFGNNLRALPFPVGFDRGAHLEYIRYVQDRKAL